MPMHGYKRTGHLRAGFDYQDLVAIEVLIDFYRQRDLYSWVELEAEDPSFGSIEDVVVCHPDGLHELIQVKFTADPDASANSLSWKWLTADGGVQRQGRRRRARRSLLQKWADTTCRHIAQGTLKRAQLKTDRIPDPVFKSCLNGNQVDYTLLPEDIKSEVVRQLGSSETAQTFFNVFEFVHSQPVLDDLERKLWSRVSSDTDGGGWASFRQQVQRWSTRIGEPEPDGKIRYIHLKQVFSKDRPKPLPQGFLVPAGYSVPDDSFHKWFLEDVIGSNGLTVLWGPPGQGKSTYLSNCVARIDPKEAVCIRHHYFLSADDRSKGRFSYWAIASSLEYQLEAVIPDLDVSNKGLGEILDEAAALLKDENRRLVVIVDGLDHVWREHRDHEDMKELFEALLPLPDNVRLIVGTQKVASEHLPARLLNALPAQKWTELPAMSHEAVFRWLCIQDESGRLNLQVAGDEARKESLRSVSGAFHGISGGLPLHLIYSFEALVRTGKEITVDDVKSLPSCPTGDIRDYYNSLWQRVSQKSKVVLHVLAGLEFGPPPFALQECFGNDSFEALADISHLLDYRELEIRPFHGSLFAFVSEMPGHEAAFNANAAQVVAWLKNGAPDYWRWAWLGITEAQLGIPETLMAEPSRKWAIDSLVSGYPVEQLTSVLDHAERAAFDAFDLPRLLNFRSLKERALSGTEYGTSEWHLFQQVALSVSEDPYVGALVRTSLHQLPAEILPFIVRSSEETARADTILDVVDELARRDSLHSDNGFRDSGFRRSLAGTFAAVVANDSSDRAQDFEEIARRYDNPIRLIEEYAREAILASNFDNVLCVGIHWSSDALDRDVLAALCLEGLKPAAKPELKALTHPAVRSFALAKGGPAKAAQSLTDLTALFSRADSGGTELSHEIRWSAYEAFFNALASGLSTSTAHGRSSVPINTDDSWLVQAVLELERVAGVIAQRWNELHRWPTLGEFYDSLNLQPPVSRNITDFRFETGIRLALRDVAVDLCIIAKGLDAHALIDSSDIESVLESPFWLDELWLDAFSERLIPLHTPGAVQTVIDRVGVDLDAVPTEFHERTSTAIKLGLFASNHGLKELARRELSRAVSCLLGYGSHKDLFALEVLISLDLLAKQGVPEARGAILELAGEFEAITEYTDGDETDYVREEYYRSIIQHFPERVAACYAHLIRDGEWRYAQALAIAFSENDEVQSRFGQALLETYISPSEVRSLRKGSSAVRPYTKSALEVVETRIGLNTFRSEEGDESRLGNFDSPIGITQSNEGEESLPNPKDFPPGMLMDLLEVARGRGLHDFGRGLVGEWLKYWTACGLGDEVLDNLNAATSGSGHEYHTDSALDEAFEISLEVQGRSKALCWVQLAHVQNGGWERMYGGNDVAEARMRKVAATYPEQWRQFIRNTSTPKYDFGATRNGIAVGKSRLVYYLVEVGESDLALRYALEMVRIFKEELTDQPTQSPEWSR